MNSGAAEALCRPLGQDGTGLERVIMRATRFPPGVTALRTYERAWLRGDALAGVAVAAYLIPQVMAYAGVAGLPPVVGLWAGAVSLVVYAIFGSSPQVSVGPESTTALMTAVALSGLAAGQPERYGVLAAALAGLVGLICLVARLARLAFLAELLSGPVLVGYLAGVAVLMVVSQLGRMTGLTLPGDNAVAEVGSVLRRLDEVHAPTAVLAVAALAFLLLASRLSPRAPIALVGMLLSAAAVAAFDLRAKGISVVGAVPRDLPSLRLPELGMQDLGALLPAALGIAIVAFTDDVLTARAFATRNGTALDANQELLAVGAANLAAAAAQGFPVSSSASRTAIGDALGSRTQVHSLVALGTVILAVVFLNPVLAAFPNAALGALVVYAAIRLIDVSEFRRIAAFRRTEGALAVATTVGVLVAGVLPGVLVAIAFSVLDLLHRVTRPHDGILGYVPGVAGMHDIDDYPSASLVPGLVVYRYDSPLFFANAQDFVSRALAAIDGAPTPVRWFLLNTEANVTVDITAADTLESLRQEVDRRGIVFALARVKQDLRVDLERSGFVAKVGQERIFMTLPTAVQAYAAWSDEASGPRPDPQEPSR